MNFFSRAVASAVESLNEGLVKTGFFEFYDDDPPPFEVCDRFCGHLRPVRRSPPQSFYVDREMIFVELAPELAVQDVAVQPLDIVELAPELVVQDVAVQPDANVCVTIDTTLSGEICAPYAPSYLRAWAAGPRKRSGRRGRRGRVRQRGNGRTGLEREMVDYLRITAPAIPPSLRDVTFPLTRKTQIITIRRGYDAGIVNTANGAPSAGVIAPTLSLFPDFTDFTNLFDAYRFECIRVTFTPVQNNALSTSSRLYSVIDYDDANA